MLSSRIVLTLAESAILRRSPPLSSSRRSARAFIGILVRLGYLRRLLRLLRLLTSSMVAVAQLVRAPDCGSGGCGFNPRQPPLDT